MSQSELDLRRRAKPNSMPLETIRSQASQAAAFTLAIISSGLNDQEIAVEVGIDAGTFSKIKRGLATLQADDLAKFCWVVNNRIYPEWVAYQIGCTLVEIETETQKLLREANEENRKKDIKIEALMEALGGKSK